MGSCFRTPVYTMQKVRAGSVGAVQLQREARGSRTFPGA